jgi:hypothetical protein
LITVCEDAADGLPRDVMHARAELLQDPLERIRGLVVVYCDGEKHSLTVLVDAAH